MIAGVSRIYGDERHVSHIRPSTDGCGLDCVSFGNHLFRKFNRNALFVNGNEADGMDVVHRAQCLDDACGAGAVAGRGEQFCLNQVVGLRFADIRVCNSVIAALALVDGFKCPVLARPGSQYADHGFCAHTKLLDDASFVVEVFLGLA